MTEQTPRKGRRLSAEILGVLAITAVIAIVLFGLLRLGSSAIVYNIIAARDMALTEEQYFQVDVWLLNLSVLVSVGFFVILFLFLLGERLSYIRDVIKGIDALQTGQMEHQVPVEGNNELTRLAEAVNYLSATQKQMKEKERALAEEKEQFIRTLSHDIRTPLTSIMAYSEFMLGDSDSPAQHREYAGLIQKKALQIKDLTDILLDGGKRSPEYFEDARLLMQQLADEFAESLENEFHVLTDLTGCSAFAGHFDVQELLRVFDNLVSNIRKYADRAQPVELSIAAKDHQLVIRQKNAKCSEAEPQESYRLGLNSIRRIAHNYAGQVEIQQDDSMFSITITLSEF